MLPSIRPTALPSRNQSNHIADHTQWPASLTASFSSARRASSARSLYSTQQQHPQQHPLLSVQRIRAEFQTTQTSRRSEINDKLLPALSIRRATQGAARPPQRVIATQRVDARSSSPRAQPQQSPAQPAVSRETRQQGNKRRKGDSREQGAPPLVRPSYPAR